MTSQLKPYKFETTGVEIAIEPLPSSMIGMLRRQFPPPRPPMMKVARPDGSTIEVEDPANDAYNRELENWTFEMEHRMRKLYIVSCVHYRLTDADKEQVHRRRTQAATVDLLLDDNDLVVFVSTCAITNDAEYLDFIQACRGVPPNPKSTNGATTTR